MNMKKSTPWWVVVGLAFPAVAFAQGERWERRYRVEALGGGMAYSGRAATVTQPGAAYGVALSGDIVPWVAGEIGYVGATYRTEGLISQTARADIVENGGQAAVKVAPPVDWTVRPFALGGVSVQRLSVSREQNAAGFVADGTEVRLPVGVGFD